MKDDFTDVTLVVDRSGSMDMCKDDATGGINNFIKEQAALPGQCFVTLVQFDDAYDFVHRGVPAKYVPKFTLVPRGMTALLDAVGKAINETGERLAKMDEADRPAIVAFVIVTDGHENASCEFTRSQIKEMIERQQRDYNWHFTFLGANQDAFREAGKLGICKDATADYDYVSTSAAFDAAAQSLGNIRAGTAESFCYSDSQRRSMK